VKNLKKVKCSSEKYFYLKKKKLRMKGSKETNKEEE
jgi:hypothetical protein